MSMTDKIREFEMRFVRASGAAGIIELMLRFIFHYDMFGYLGTGLILYSIFHYVQIVRRDRHGKD